MKQTAFVVILALVTTGIGINRNALAVQEKGTEAYPLFL